MSLLDGADDRTGDLRRVDGLRRLMQLPGIGPQRAIQLASAFRDWDRLADAKESDLRTVLGEAAVKVRELIGDTRAPSLLPDGVRAIGFFDDEWPVWLRGIPRPPAVA